MNLCSQLFDFLLRVRELRQYTVCDGFCNAIFSSYVFSIDYVLKLRLFHPLFVRETTEMSYTITKNWATNEIKPKCEKCKLSEDHLPLRLDNPFADDHQKKKQTGVVFKETTTHYPLIKKLLTEFLVRSMTTI